MTIPFRRGFRAAGGGATIRGRAMTDELEILVHDEGNFFARWKNVLFQVRSGDMTPSLLGRVESAARLLRASVQGPVGMIAIIEDGASLAGADVREQQAKLLRALLADGRSHMVAVVLGESVGTRAVQTVMRVLLRGTPRLSIAKTPEDAADWLAERLENVTGRELRALITEARARAARGPE